MLKKQIKWVDIVDIYIPCLNSQAYIADEMTTVCHEKIVLLRINVDENFKQSRRSKDDHSFKLMNAHLKEEALITAHARPSMKDTTTRTVRSVIIGVK